MGVLNDNTRLGASAAGAYEIERSVRFNSADTVEFERDFGSAGNRKKWTVSFWFKRSTVGASGNLFGMNGSYNDYIFFNSSDNLEWYVSDASGYTGPATTNAVYRDTSAWYHIVWIRDTENATATDRTMVYVNGVRQTLSAQPTVAEDFEGRINEGENHTIGHIVDATHCNGYMAEFYFIDGNAYAASYFGETDTDTGAWVPKKFAGTYGSNGCYLNFSDNSNTTAATLGKDSSGNSNNWTPANLSVAAGEGNDSVTDTPTNNYCTWNPLDWVWGGFDGHQAHDRLRNGALSTVDGAGKNAYMRGTFYVESGKWYYEVKGISHENDKIGWAREEDHVAGPLDDAETTHHAMISGNGQFQSSAPTGAAGGTTYGGSIAGTDVIGCAIDLDSNTVAFHKGGQWGDGSGNWDESYADATKISITNYKESGYSPAYLDGSHTTGSAIHANFGQQGFAHTPPTGFKALCTANLPLPTINIGSDYVKATAYTGNATDDRSLTVGFQPNLTILKQRDYTKNWYWYDSIRGANEQLLSNGHNAETEIADRMQAFESNGIQIGASSEINNNSSTYVNYSWKESAAAGFDIVSYNGDSSAQTISHGLGVAPEIVIVKRRNADSSWRVYYKFDAGLGAGVRYVDLGADAASVYSATAMWNGTVATSSVFSVGTDSTVNTSGGTYIAYCFTSIKGYSIFKPYRGNGQAGTDGQFVYLGFRPAIVIVKNLDATGPWNVFDNARESYNQMQKNLRLQTAGQEDSARYIDFLSNGFKWRNSGSESNTDNQSYLIMAWAETPFKYANAR